MWSKLKNFFVQLFVLFPLSFGMGACWFFAAVAIITQSRGQEQVSIALAITVYALLLIGLIVCVILYRLVRYGRYPDVWFIFDLLVSPLRVLFQFIAVIIAFIAMFSGIESDYQEDDGIISFLFLFIPNSDFSPSTSIKTYSWGYGAVSGRIMNFLKTAFVILPASLFTPMGMAIIIGIFESISLDSVANYIKLNLWLEILLALISLIIAPGIIIKMRGQKVINFIGVIKTTTYKIKIKTYGEIFEKSQKERYDDVYVFSWYGLVCYLTLILFAPFSSIISTILSIVFPPNSDDWDFYYKTSIADYEADDTYPFFFKLLHMHLGIVSEYDIK